MLPNRQLIRINYRSHSMVPRALPKNHDEIIAGAAKAIAHLRSQLERKRLGLLFGSGISRDFYFPGWAALVRNIAHDPSVDGSRLLKKLTSIPDQGKSLSSISQVMFGRYRERTIQACHLKGPLTFLEEQKVRSEWMRLIHKVLYAKVDLTDRKKSFDEHRYLNYFLPLIKRSAMTVNYNFDDTLEQLLLLNRTPEECLTTRGYETATTPNAQFQKDSSVIYHPNGYLPSIFEDGASPDLVFADDSFQDQLLSAATGQYVQLSNFLFRNTCLLIGLSLTDSTLQHLLRQSAVSNPGHIHYIVHFVDEPKQYDHTTFQAIFDANFDAYNLFTMFLDRNGIRCLAELVSTPSTALALRFPKGKHKFVYYIIGSIGAGKSTATSNLRCLTTYDEWIDPRRPDMAVPERRLSPEVIRDINSWTAEQFRKKNISVSQNPNGIHIIDRCPLDPLTFGKPGQRRKKAADLLKAVTNCGRDRIQKGQIIYLDAELNELRNRLSYRHKYWTEEELDELQKKIVEVYGDVKKTTLCTQGRTISAVIKELVRIIFIGEYVEVDVGRHLQKFSKPRRKT